MAGRPNSDAVQPRFRSVGETADILGMSVVTLYRAIHSGQFPAIKIRGRFVIPARVIDEMESSALSVGLVDAGDFVKTRAS
ncbi:helix-turn-helix domain-containing protein [Plantactinospora sonchi]|uniref:Helix-turn-helix domain-containing protein n=1 Tax=Plantactinospora sonchi TaxID=1544735 RepID=A0ABU7RUK1_9ACTN